MAELQTIAAVFDLLAIAYKTGLFLKRVKDADKIAVEIDDRLKRLASVLEGVESVLQSRDATVGPSTQASDAAVARRIGDSINACSTTLKELEAKLGKLPDLANARIRTSSEFVERVKKALHQPTIQRINAELEARVQALSTDLAVLQLFDQSSARSAVKSNHAALLQAIENLGNQVVDGNRLLNKMIIEHRQQSMQSEQSLPVETTDSPTKEPSNGVLDAIESFSESLQAAVDIHERFSTEYAPDVRSVRGRASSGSPDSGFATPAPGTISPSPQSEPSSAEDVAINDADDEDLSAVIMPLYILDKTIRGHVEHARIERIAMHYQQAERNLSQAIKSSKIRETHYGVPFTARAVMQEEMALLYQKQKKWAEAVNCVHQLLCETPAPAPGSDPAEHVTLSQARQHQLLASIYHDRHLINAGPALSHRRTDIEQAEIHARIAFNKRWAVYGIGERPEDEAERHFACIQLLIRILEMQGKTVDSGVMNELLTDCSSSISESTRRTSTIHSYPADNYEVVDKHEMLIEAIKSRDTEQIQNLLAARDLDLERLSRDGRTYLMYAAEYADESIVHRLLDPETGAYVNTANKDGLTALHFAVMRQRHDMIRCLLDHDADILPRDRSMQAPITKAVENGDKMAVQIFSDHDESTLQVKGDAEWSLLHYAVTSKKAGTDMICLLLDHAPELKDAVDLSGQTALHHCVAKERLEHARTLLEHEHRLDVHATDSISRTPLYLAASKASTRDRERMVLLLLEHGAEVDPRKVPLRIRDYGALGRDRPRRDSNLSRTSVSTSGSIGTTSTGTSRFSRALSSLRGNR
jgi:ankyrin repeat protein